jgi:hypothetical protein
MPKYRSDDPAMLLPAFRSRVIALMGRLTALGFDPVLKDGLRTPEEALRNARRGTGIVDSMHLYGCAADLVCGQHGWDCSKHGCDFFESLGEQAERCGLFWGGRWRKPDKPHVQGIPPTKRIQDQMRALGRGCESPRMSARDALVSRHLREMVP